MNQHSAETALDALQDALKRCLEVMTPAALKADRAQGLHAILKLNKTLDAATQLIDAVFAPETIAQVKPGNALKEALQAKKQQIKTVEKQLDTDKKTLAELEKKDERLRQMSAERDALQQQCRELQANIERFGAFDEADVEALRQQVKRLDEAMPPHGKDAMALEQQFSAQAERFVQLAETTRQRLAEQVNHALQQAEAREQELRQSFQNIQDAMRRYADADDQLAKRREALALYEQADRAVAAALPNARNVGDLLDDAERLLRHADDALKDARSANEHARKMTELGYA